jgi:hypothetical protein
MAVPAHVTLAGDLSGSRLTAAATVADHHDGASTDKATAAGSHASYATASREGDHPAADRSLVSIG